MTSIQSYKETLATAVKKGLPDMDSSAWKAPIARVDSAILVDAYETGATVQQFLEAKIKALAKKNPMYNDVIITPRPKAKEMYRFKNKKDDGTPDAAFKAQCDLMAFRILCTRPKYISQIIEDLRADIEKQTFKKDTSITGQLRIRRKIFDSNGKVNTFAANVDTYWPKYGYMVELQIGLKVATIMFTRNSWLRDHPKDDTTMPNFSDPAVEKQVGFSLFVKSNAIALTQDGDITKELDAWFQAWEKIYGKSEQSSKDKKAMYAALSRWINNSGVATSSTATSSAPKKSSTTAASKKPAAAGSARH